MNWGPGEILFTFALALILLLSVFMIVCRRYEDGIVGNVALGLLAIASSVALWDALHGELELPQPVYRLAIVAFALFLLRHTYRFAMFHWHGAFGWKRPSDCPASADAR